MRMLSKARKRPKPKQSKRKVEDAPAAAEPERGDPSAELRIAGATSNMRAVRDASNMRSQRHLLDTLAPCAFCGADAMYVYCTVRNRTLRRTTRYLKCNTCKRTDKITVSDVPENPAR